LRRGVEGRGRDTRCTTTRSSSRFPLGVTYACGDCKEGCSRISFVQKGVNASGRRTSRNELSEEKQRSAKCCCLNDSPGKLIYSPPLEPFHFTGAGGSSWDPAPTALPTLPRYYWSQPGKSKGIPTGENAPSHDTHSSVRIIRICVAVQVICPINGVRLARSARSGRVGSAGHHGTGMYYTGFPEG
jgi:hypothetical protein